MSPFEFCEILLGARYEIPVGSPVSGVRAGGSSMGTRRRLMGFCKVSWCRAHICTKKSHMGKKCILKGIQVASATIAAFGAQGA